MGISITTRLVETSKFKELEKKWLTFGSVHNLHTTTEFHSC